MVFYDSEFVAYVCITIVLIQVCRFLIRMFYNHVLSVKLGIKFVDFKYLGKWAVVTGATDGIGKAYAEALAREGMDVFLISRTQSKLDEVAEEIKTKYKVATKTLTIDFTQGEEIYSMIEKQLSELEIGILVNNVGISYPYPEYFLEVEDKEQLFADIIKCNCVSVMNMCKIVMPGMVERKRGAIVNMSSLAAAIPNPLLCVYSGSKAFVEKFSQDLAIEYESRGLTIQCVLPGYVATKMSKIRSATWMAPTPTEYVSDALRTLGIQSRTTGYYPHTLMAGVIHAVQYFTPTLADTFVMNTLLNIRKRALKQKTKS